MMPKSREPSKIRTNEKLTHEQLIRLGPIIEVTRAAIWTTALADERPVSLVIIADQESAKTEVLKYFSPSPTLIFFSDLTTKAIMRLRHQIESGEVRDIVLMDLVKIVSHQRSITDSTIQTLAGLMEEGVTSFADAGGVDKWSDFTKVAVLVPITPDYYRASRGKWKRTGFLTRFLPVHFTLSISTVELVHRRIVQGHKLPEPHKIVIPKERITVNLPSTMAKYLEQWAIDWGKQQDVHGFRHHKQLRSLIKAMALVDNRTCVLKRDLELLEKWLPLFSIDTPAQL